MSIERKNFTKKSRIEAQSQREGEREGGRAKSKSKLRNSFPERETREEGGVEEGERRRKEKKTRPKLWRFFHQNTKVLVRHFFLVQQNSSLGFLKQEKKISEKIPENSREKNAEKEKK